MGLAAQWPHVFNNWLYYHILSPIRQFIVVSNAICNGQLKTSRFSHPMYACTAQHCKHAVHTCKQIAFKEENLGASILYRIYSIVKARLIKRGYFKL
jgi:hypothetical protein